MDKPVKVALVVAGCVGVAYFIYNRSSSNNNNAVMVRERQIRDIGNIVYNTDPDTGVATERTREERTFNRTNAFNRPVSFVVTDLFAYSRFGSGTGAGAVSDDISGIAGTARGVRS